MKRIRKWMIFVTLICGLWGSTVSFAAEDFGDLDETEIIFAEGMEDEIPEELLDYLTKDDYEVSYVEDENGSGTWYLVSNLDGTRLKISEINNIVNEAEQREAKIAALQKKCRVIEIVGVILVVIFLCGMIAAWMLYLEEKKKNHRKHTRGKKRVESGKKERRSIEDRGEKGSISFEE